MQSNLAHKFTAAASDKTTIIVIENFGGGHDQF